MAVSNVKVSPTGITFHHSGTSQIVVATRHPKKEGPWVAFGLLADAPEGDLAISGTINPGDGIAVGDGTISGIQYAELPAVTPPPEEKPKPEEPKPEEKPTSELLVVGWNGGGWGTADIADAKLGKHTGVRLENPASISNYTAAGLKVLWLANHYSTGGVQSINRAEFLSRVKTAYAAGAWRIEIENEVGGNWFWGSNAEAAAAFAAYAELLHESHAAAPNARLLASWDGGHAGGSHFGMEVLKHDPSLHNQPWLDWSLHPYAGSGANPAVASINPPSGLCGHLPGIDRCHAETGCNVILSELGFPTITGTGDSPHCTEEQQKHGHEMCLAYCRERLYVEGYFAYGYRDGNGAKGYGLVRSDDSKKPAFSVVHP